MCIETAIEIAKHPVELGGYGYSSCRSMRLSDLIACASANSLHMLPNRGGIPTPCQRFSFTAAKTARPSRCSSAHCRDCTSIAFTLLTLHSLSLLAFLCPVCLDLTSCIDDSRHHTLSLIACLTLASRSLLYSPSTRTCRRLGVSVVKSFPQLRYPHSLGRAYDSG